MKRSYVVTLDAPDVPEEDVRTEQAENARQVILRAVRHTVPAGVHVTVCEQRGLPLHPFKPHPFPTP